MTLIQKLAALRAVQRKKLPEIESLEDMDIILAIGNAQAEKREYCAKHLLADKLGAPATVRRRLDRLIKLGIVSKYRDNKDQRVFWLTLDAAFARRFNKTGLGLL